MGHEFTSRLCGPGGTLWATGGTFGAEFGGIDRAPPARDSNGPASMAERESRARSEIAGDGTASGGKVQLGDNPSRQLGPLHRGPGYESRRVFCFALIYDDLRQPIPAPGIVAIGTARANSSRRAVPQQASRPAGDFSCIVCFWARGEEDILVNRWVHLWIKQS